MNGVCHHTAAHCGFGRRFIGDKRATEESDSTSRRCVDDGVVRDIKGRDAKKLLEICRLLAFSMLVYLLGS